MRAACLETALESRMDGIAIAVVAPYQDFNLGTRISEKEMAAVLE